MRYIVFGHGRTGTHFVADLLGSCLPGTWEEVSTQEGLLMSETDDVIFHTNDREVVFHGLYRRLIETAKIVYCYRQGGLAVLASLAVAERTKEWNYYSNTSVEPFEMDVDKFVDDLNKYYHYHRSVMGYLRKNFNEKQTAIICYEDILDSGDHRRYVCEKVGLEFFVKSEIIGPDDDGMPGRGRNPRNYRKIITNYAELERVSDEHLQKHPPPWVSQ